MPSRNHRGAGIASGLAAPEQADKKSAPGMKTEGALKDEADCVSGHDPRQLADCQAEDAERTRLAAKRLSTVRAQLALRGIVVQVVDGGFVAAAWGYHCNLPTLDELEALEAGIAKEIAARGAAA